jgi:hypothetical protein
MDCFKWLFTKKVVVQPVPPPIETVAPVDIRPPNKTPWLDYAMGNLGKCEGKDDEWIVSLFKNTSYDAKSSADPWCAAFVCSMIELAGYKSVKSASAHSMEKTGVECVAVPGAVLVWRHKYGSLAGHYHTNFLLTRVDGKLYKCIGGNQGNAVSIATYSTDAHDLVCCRMPQPK